MIGTLVSFRKHLSAWYAQHRRDLPWRPPLGKDAPEWPDPYHVLVSELMLQQTQVATVIDYFHRFIEKLPTLAHLAQAPQQEVLRLWQGLGYYSRARNLQAAAQAVIARHAGELPADIESLLALPGVGRYTAGAIASLAFGHRTPILDGNVKRVLCRLDAIRADAMAASTVAQLWKRAQEIMPELKSPSVFDPQNRTGPNPQGDFNSALMELGATVCTPRAPQCLVCPVRVHCQAFDEAIQDQLPVVPKARPTPLVRRFTFCIRRPGQAGDEWLIERRPSQGRWAGLWQFITCELQESCKTEQSLRQHVKEALGLNIRSIRALGQVKHALTHRRYEFEVYTCELTRNATTNLKPDQAWTTLAGLSDYPLPKPHLTIAKMLVTRGCAVAPTPPRSDGL